MGRKRNEDHDPGHHIRKQVAEDTCEAHGVFCCPRCFDMEPVSDVGVAWWEGEVAAWKAQLEEIRALPKVEKT